MWPIERRFAIIAIIVAIVIVYGSLYPFTFNWSGSGWEALTSLFSTWSKKPGKADFFANIILYLPLGLFVFLALTRKTALGLRFLMVLVLGAGLSVAMELIQHFDIGRDSEATDVYANTLGTAVGAVLAAISSVRANYAQPWTLRVKKAPILLASAWMADRLYPFVPVIDLHKYWSAIKPVVYPEPLNDTEIFRHVAAWSSIFLLIDDATGHRKSILAFVVFSFLLVTGEIFVVNGSLSLPELVGMAVAFFWAIFTIAFPRFRLFFTLGVLAIYVLIERLEPFTFAFRQRAFGWIPFLSFMRGSITVDVLSFLEKSFFYGTLIWFISMTGAKLRTATLIVSGSLLLTSIAQVYLPDRSAEITDSIVALAAGVVLSLLADDERSTKRKGTVRGKTQPKSFSGSR